MARSTQRPEDPAPLTQQERQRYARHLSLPQVGEQGQLQLKSARVLLIGVGGLGSAAALYLAAAGIGQLGLVDFDQIELSNLQRQILYRQEDLGQSKAERARARLLALNPDVEITAYPKALDKALAYRLFPQFDLIIDGSDNYHTRYLINDMCLLHGKANLSASIHQFEGRLALFCSPDGPCYRCLFPSPPPVAMTATCSEAGVLGVLPGILGLLQASEAIKYLLKLGASLSGRYLIYDALSLAMREIKISRHPHCRFCRQPLAYKKIHEYGEACSPALISAKTGAKQSIAAPELARLLQSKQEIILLDVRAAEEVEPSLLGEALRIPLADLSERLAELKREAFYIVYCQKGQRSLQAVALMQKHQFSQVKSLHGGLEKWHAYIKECKTTREHS